MLRRHDLIDEPIRSLRAILEAEEEFFNKIWYDRHQGLMRNVARGRQTIEPSILKQARAAAKHVEQKYGKRQLGPWSDFDWGMLNGKLSALRWILGSEWDFLDT